MTLLSALVVARGRPSGTNATENRLLVWPVRASAHPTRASDLTGQRINGCACSGFAKWPNAVRLGLPTRGQRPGEGVTTLVASWPTYNKLAVLL